MIPMYAFCKRNFDLLGVPFSQGNYTYATDGRIMVRIPRVLDVVEQAKPDCSNFKFGVRVDIQSVDVNQYKDLFVEKECEECKDGGIECEDCEGKGEIVFYSRNNFEYWVDCDMCEGRGRIIIKPEECGICGGVKKIKEYKTIEINGLSFFSRYFELMQMLPYCKLYPKTVSDNICSFVFDGGEGLLTCK